MNPNQDNNPSTSSGQVPPASVPVVETPPVVQPPVQVPVESSMPSAPTPANIGQVTSTPPADPAVQAAEHVATLPDQNSETGKKGSKLMIILIVLIVLVVLGVLGYVLMTQQSSGTETQVEDTQTVVEEPTPTVIPTPADEIQEADQIDVTYPDAEVNTVETDVQAL